MAEMLQGGVFIKGEGIAALSAAQMLSKRGVPIAIQQEQFYNRPVLLLPEISCWLLMDIWDKRQDILSSGTVISVKKVYEQNGQKTEFSYSGYAVDQNILQKSLKSILMEKYNTISWLSPFESSINSKNDWIINAVPYENNCYECFGNRCLAVFRVRERDRLPVNAECRMIMSRNYWIFFFPVNNESAIVQVMHPHGLSIRFEEIADVILNKTGISLENLNHTGNLIFNAAPRILRSVCENREIPIGQSIAKYDPIAGDGTGHALRSADWACKIILSALQGNDFENLLQQYHRSIKHHFIEHHATCQGIYKSFKGLRWKQEFFENDKKFMFQNM